MQQALIADHLATVQRAQARFGQLSAAQINHRPAPDKWSIGLCLEHLMVTDATYTPAFSAILAGTYRPTLWGRISPFSGYLGAMLVRETGAEVQRPAQSPPAFRPSESSHLPADIVQRFVAHGHELNAVLAKLTVTDTTVIIASPALGLITYPLSQCIEILVRHTERHVRQAERVMESEGFPEL